jgi:histidine triad (HIT) family protein
MTNTPTNELKEEEELCVFCKKIADEQLGGDVVAFPPLNPVTKGHWLVVPTKHAEDVSEDPQISARVMEVAAEIARNYDNVNIITSKGEYASQTVKHLHLHIVPRTKDDGLKLPWSNQSEKSILEGQLNKEEE